MKAFLTIAMAAAFLLCVNAETRADNLTCSQKCNKKCENREASCNAACSTWCINHGYR